MITVATTLSSFTLTSVATSLPAPELIAHTQWLTVWLATLGLLGMGLFDVFGGDDGNEATAAEGEGDDFLGDGFGPTMEADGGEPDDAFDGLGEEDDLNDVEPRIDDLETDIDDLAGTVSAVHGDHDELKESMEGIEDNVRKLLEVYEVVTQGMNPFADDPPAMGGAAGEASAFGLLEEEEGTEDPVETEAAADAEALFEETVDAEATDDADALLADARDEGVTFDELKSEFEFIGDEGEGVDAAASDPPADGLADAPDPQPTASDGSGKPYLRTLPGGFAAELVVMEWIDYLVSESSVAEAMQALRYYGTVEWIGEDVSAHLQTVLSGMAPPRQLAATDGGRPAELSVDHHTESLEYISQLRAIAGEGRPLGESPGHRVGESRRPEEEYGVQR